MGDDEIPNTVTIGKKWVEAMKKMQVSADQGYSSPLMSHEEKMRERYPAVNEAWERYKVILRLYETNNE